MRQQSIQILSLLKKLNFQTTKKRITLIALHYTNSIDESRVRVTRRYLFFSLLCKISTQSLSFQTWSNVKDNHTTHYKSNIFPYIPLSSSITYWSCFCAQIDVSRAILIGAYTNNNNILHYCRNYHEWTRKLFISFQCVLPVKRHLWQFSAPLVKRVARFYFL